MAEQELRRMSRAELIEIIYLLKQHEADLLKKNEMLEQRLADRTLKMKQAGSIAQAALALNGVFDAAQAAADEYLTSVEAIDPETEKKAEAVLAKAREEADAIRENAKQESQRILAKAERKRAQTEHECTLQREQTEQEVRQRWDAFEEQAQKILNDYTKPVVIPPERNEG